MLLALPSVARAVDADNDGWHAAGTIPDCNDNDPAVHPAAPENPKNDKDDDCDGRKVVRREFVESFSDANASEWTLDDATIQGGILELEPAGGAASAEFLYDITWTRGRFHVQVEVDALDNGASCYVDVKTTAMGSPTSLSLALGTNNLNFGSVGPAMTIDLLRVRCDGGTTAAASIAWLTLENGAYLFGPRLDLTASVSPMKLPASGRMSFVRESENASYLMTGSDVGGFAYSLDGEEWSVANGTYQDFVDGGDYGVWDGWIAEGTVVPRTWVLTGDKDSGEGGGIWYSLGFGGDWTEILAADGMGFSKHFDECTDDATEKPISSGKLLVQDPADTDDTFYVLSQDADQRGVYYITDADGTPTSCAPYDPANLPSEAIPRAAAIVEDDLGTSYLLLGYGPRNSLADAGMGGLYACELVSSAGSCSGTLECWEVDDGDTDTDEEDLDVRDIEVNPLIRSQIYVADGGKRGDTDGSCSRTHSTVTAVDLAYVGSALDFTMWDTDSDDTTASPSWSVDSVLPGDPWVALNDADSAGMYGCVKAHDDEMIGDLVPPGDDASAWPVVSVAMAPDADHLFAFYSLGHGMRSHNCVRHFRSEVDEPLSGLTADTELGWSPLMDYSDRDDDFYTSGSADRRANVNGTEAWFGDADGDGANDEPLIENFTGLMHDALIWDHGDETLPYRLLLAAQWLWWVPQTGVSVDHDNDTGTSDLTAVGWDSDPSSDDLDEIYFEHAWDTDLTFQDATMVDLVVDSNVGFYVEDRVYTAIADLGMASGYGAASPSQRRSMSRACQVAGLRTGGFAVDAFRSPVMLTPELWYIFSDQNDPHDPSNLRMITHKGNGAWCWDGAGVSGRTNFLAYDATDARWELECQDSGYVDPSLGTWSACDTAATLENDAFGMDDIGTGDAVGVPRDIVALGANVALIAANGACTSTVMTDGDGDGDYEDELCPSGSGEGLWVVTHGAAGLAYEQVHFDATTVGCTEQEFFEGLKTSSTTDATRPQNTLSVHPSTAVSGGTGTARVFVSSRNCGVADVEFDVADPGDTSTTTWATWDVSTCPNASMTFPFGSAALSPQVTFGVTASPDGDHILVYGGASNGSTSSGGGVCEVDLASGTTRGVIPATALRFAIQSVTPHPHIADTYVVGGIRDTDCTSCGAAGVYVAEARWRFTGSGRARAWAYGRVSGDDLEHRQVTALDWGVGRHLASSPASADHVYAATAGGGPWDLDIEW